MGKDRYIRIMSPPYPVLDISRTETIERRLSSYLLLSLMVFSVSESTSYAENRHFYPQPIIYSTPAFDILSRYRNPLKIRKYTTNEPS